MSGPEQDAARPASVDDLKLLLRALNLEGLLKTKQTSRNKDKLDRVILERALEELKKG